MAPCTQASLKNRSSENNAPNRPAFKKRHVLFQAMGLSPLPRLCPLRALRMLWSLDTALRLAGVAAGLGGLGGSSAAGKACCPALCLRNLGGRAGQDGDFCVCLNRTKKEMICYPGTAAARAWWGGGGGTRKLGAETTQWLGQEPSQKAGPPFSSTLRPYDPSSNPRPFFCMWAKGFMLACIENEDSILDCETQPQTITTSETHRCI